MKEFLIRDEAGPFAKDINWITLPAQPCPIQPPRKAFALFVATSRTVTYRKPLVPSCGLHSNLPFIDCLHEAARFCDEQVVHQSSCFVGLQQSCC